MTSKLHAMYGGVLRERGWYRNRFSETAARGRARMGCLGVLCALVLACLSAGPARGQVFYGSVVGTVTDASGALVPGATVTITKTETNESRTETTNGSGDYLFSTVPTGTYKVVVSKPGFADFQKAGVALALNTQVRVNAVLGLGSQAQSVEVSGDTPMLQTDSADVHGEVTAKEFSDLPQPTRTYQGLLGLVPGISPPAIYNDSVNNPMRSMRIAANGTSTSGTVVRIDGATATNPWVQFLSTAVPSTDAIQTVNVVTASSGADEGLMNGAAINLQMKSGTNQLHGSAYEYHYDNLFKARPWSLPATSRMPKLLDNDAGGTLGGPIFRDKLFFFGSYEGDFLRTDGAPSIGTIPSENARKGLFPVADSAPIYDPKTGNPDGSGRTPFPTDPTGQFYVIPQSRIDPIAAKVMALLPAPNYRAAGSDGETQNWIYLHPQDYTLEKVDSKFDYAATQKLRFFARYSYYWYNVATTPEFGSSPLSGQNTDANSFGNFWALSTSGTYAPTPHLVIQLLFGVNHTVENLFAPYANQKYGEDVLGIPGSNPGDLPEAGGFPDMYFDNWDGYGYSYPSLVYRDPLFQYTANVNWTKGQHTFKFGIDVSQQHMNHVEDQNTYLYSASGLTGLKGTNAPATGQYNDLAGFLLGLTSEVENSAMSVPWLTLRTWQFSPYVGDQWQVNKRLTVAYGTRWDYYPVPTRADRGIEFFNFDTKQFEFCGLGSIAKDCGIHVSKAQFSPRFGIAYRPMQTAVVRAGYSLNYEQINMFRDGLYNYPEQLTGDYPSADGDGYMAYGTLEQGIPPIVAPNISGGTLPVPTDYNIITTPKNFVRGYTQSYNAMVEQDFGHGWMGQLGYVGTHSLHGHTRMNINYGQIGGGTASQPFNNGTYATGDTASVIDILPLESMVYNSLQAGLQHRFTNGFEIGAAYTWSKWRGTCCDDHGDGSPQNALPQLFNTNEALMPQDRTNNLQISWMYELPFGEKKAFLQHGAGAAVLGGWQVNAVTSFESGTPFSVTSANLLNAPGSSQRADQVKPYVTILGGKGPGSKWFDTTAFAPVTGQRLGTARWDALRGPGYANADLNVFRNFKIVERVNMKFSLDVYNLTNHPHWGNPNGNVNSSNFGIISSAGNPQSRTIDERNVKFGAKFTF